jgi:hypothetical protein
MPRLIEDSRTIVSSKSDPRAATSTRAPCPVTPRFRCARAECNQAAAPIEAAFALGIPTEPETNDVLTDLNRLAAMLTALAGFNT